ncbi:MAG: aldo/keto reductase [Rhodobacteraceae bacterium]|nr:MAG: aldo/keto reductase [Paracoccaceae bacterium]
MKRVTLGHDGPAVSVLCLGTMTWGNQTPEADAHAQIDMAADRGINFMDTAEMYPVNPVRAETIGRTEEIIGNWIAKGGRREDWVIATKIAGEGSVARGGEEITGASIHRELEAALKRLRTDYVDLYQFHWPNRGSYMFRKNWTYDPRPADRATVIANMEECLEALQREVDRGTIRHFGLSNESAWGTAQWLRLSEDRGLPRVQTMQNEYSLLCRLYDTDMAELSLYEDVGLIAFSPLGAGYLTGKYQGGAVPEGSRKGWTPTMGGRETPRVGPAVEAYLDIARRHGLDPVHLALAWCRTRPFMTSAIFGATSLGQLERVLGSVAVTLSDEVLAEIDAAHRAHPMPF